MLLSRIEFSPVERFARGVQKVADAHERAKTDPSTLNHCIAAVREISVILLNYPAAESIYLSQCGTAVTTPTTPYSVTMTLVSMLKSSGNLTFDNIKAVRSQTDLLLHQATED